MTDEPEPSLAKQAFEASPCTSCGLPLDEDHTPEVCAEVTAWHEEHRRRFLALDWS